MNRVFEFVDRIPLMRIRVVRYLTAGGISAATSLSLLFVLTEFFGVWYIFSSVIATSTAILVSFTLQKFWTFRNMPLDQVHVQIPLHIFLSLANIAINASALYVLVEFVHLWYVLAQVISGASLAFMNYYVYRTYIFRNVVPVDSPDVR